jgi:pyridoxamine 5'-phosphate oxidase
MRPTTLGAIARRDTGAGGPERLSVDPEALLLDWFESARRTERRTGHAAMTLATCANGQPSARVVVCKRMELDPLALIFFTSYRTKKARELDANPWAAAVFHWPAIRRQARIEGSAIRLTDPENDAGFRAFDLAKRVGIGAAARDGSGTLARVAAALGSAALHRAAPKPEDWGGFRLTAHAIELWESQGGIAHTRVRWIRSSPDPAGWRIE